MGVVMKRCRQEARICHYSCSYNLITVPQLRGKIFLSYRKEHKLCSWKMPLSIILNLLEMHNMLYLSPRIENVSLNFKMKELLSKQP